MTGTRETATRWRPGEGSPIDYLIACFADRATAERAMQQLSGAGFASDAILLLDGLEAYEDLQSVEASDARYHFALRFEELFTDPRIQRAAYYEELRDGHAGVLGHTSGKEHKERAREIVKRAHGYHISYRGRWTQEQIPSTR